MKAPSFPVQYIAHALFIFNDTHNLGQKVSVIHKVVSAWYFHHVQLRTITYYYLRQ